MVVRWIINWFKKRKKYKEDLKDYILKEYHSFLDFYNNRIDIYTSKNKFNEILARLDNVRKLFNSYKKLFTAVQQLEISSLLYLFTNYQNHEQFNQNFIKNTINSLPEDFFAFKNINLDHNQISSILKEDKINLVIAGAGSGKTTTILGKIKYLVEICKLKPEQILVLSYSNKSVDDFNDRIKQYLKYDIKAITIHAFSQKITTQVLGIKKYSVADGNIQTDAFMECLNNNSLFAQWWSEFIAYYWDDKITDSEIEAIKNGKKSPNEPNDSKIVTLNNERVKSSQEARIANFLFLNGIKYKYEEPYEIDTRTENYIQYKPDFYLVDYQIYWEHFGFDENNNTMWKEVNPAVDEKYKESWKWKIELHQKNNTKLIASFSYELQAKNWQEILTDKLKSHNVDLKPIVLTLEQLKSLIKTNKSIAKAVDLFSNLISLYEEYELTLEIIKKELIQIYGINTLYRVKLILKIFFTILNQYNIILKNKNLITFAQMLKKGYENLKSYQNNYQYLIIDEFQDISPLRIKLISQLIIDQDIKNFYFVGDDWQSIYGFSGSRVELFTNFLNHDDASVSFINNTYRNSKELINVTSNYITKDNNMTKKSLQSQKQYSYPIRIYEYQIKNPRTEETNQAEIIANLITTHYQENKNYQFLILARTNFSKEQLWINKIFYQSKKHSSNIILKTLPEAKIKFITIHGSKGLEGDFVFVLNVSNNLYGLPCQITNDPVYSLFDPSSDEMIANEERRVFYVALTRTKNIVYLLTESGNHSLYIKEIADSENIKIEYNKQEQMQNLILQKCPLCQFDLKRNDFFTSCPNYKLCGMTIKNWDIKDNNIICSSCKWIMVLRVSKYGPFYSCINVDCRFKINVPMQPKIK